MNENKTQSDLDQPNSPALEQSSEKTKPVSKPKWLKLLEQESWQAELLVSGVAIFGAFQLVGLIHELTDWLLAYLPHELIGWLPYFFVWYLSIGAVSLVVSFVAHFMMRSFWIGIIGLSSVYPQGIRRRDDLFGPVVLEKLMGENPDLLTYSRKLDDQCSLIFAGSFLFTIMMTGFALSIALVVLIGYLLSFVLPYPADSLSVAVAIVLIVLIYLNTIFSTKGLRHRGWVQKVHYPLFKLNSFLSYNIFYKPGSLLALTFRTNAKSDGHAVMFMSVVTLVVMFISLPVLLTSNALDFLDKDFAYSRDRDTQLFSSNYLDQREVNQRIIYPVISSFEQSGSALEVFIPNLAREKEALAALSDPWEDDEELSKEQNRSAKRKYELETQTKYHQFFINDKPVTKPALFHHRHNNKLEKGVTAIIPASYFEVGLNTLRIQKQYMNRAGEPIQMLIPFLYAPD